MMRILQILGVIVVSVMFLATPSMADHHKKGGSKAKVGQKGTAKNGPGPRATQKAAKQKPAAKFGGQEGEPFIDPSGSGKPKIGLDEPMGMP